jgi:hypothetical protein
MRNVQPVEIINKRIEVTIVEFFVGLVRYSFEGRLGSFFLEFLMHAPDHGDRFVTRAEFSVSAAPSPR